VPAPVLHPNEVPGLSEENWLNFLEEKMRKDDIDLI
jgi:hypothetical protein